MSLKPLSMPSKRLAASITSTDSSFQVNNILGWDGAAVSAADFGTTHYVVFRNSSNTLMELMEIDPATIASSSITITKRGLDFTGDLVTQVTANKQAWLANETIVEFGSNPPQLYQWLKEYIDGIAISGSPDASATTKGIVEVATSTEIDNNTATGGTGAALSVSPDQLFLSKYGTRLPTAGEKQALAGTGGTPSATNLYITQDNLSVDTTDQTQATQNSTVETGEANTTTKKNKVAQSFVAGRTKIRGVKLHKAADSGTFTGTVTVSLQADSNGSPSGSDLASVTFTNAQWTALATGEFTATFTAEYSMTVGTTYWIVISSSTSDNTNHPNLGTNTAGGYSSGSVKYNNTTEGWVAISTIDLYFKTLEGVVGQVIKTDSSGKIPAIFFSVTNMPIPAFYQRVETTSLGSSTDSAERRLAGFGSNTDGSVVYAILNNGTNSFPIQRFARDSYTGQYYITHQGTFSITSSSLIYMSIVVLGSYVYVYHDGGTNMACTRFDAATLLNETTMTVPTIAMSGTDVAVTAWTDGTSLYFHPVETTPTTVYKQSVSGTTISAVTTGTPNATFDNYTIGSNFFDGTTIYGARDTNSGLVINLYKYNDVYATNPTSSSVLLSRSPMGSASTLGSANIDSNRMYLVRNSMSSSAGTGTTVKNYIEFFPVTKPA